MDVPVFTVDAFTKTPFGGNPASVCISGANQGPGANGKTSIQDAATMQSIAREMNLSETAFIQELELDSLTKGVRFGLRWFTPTTEVKLCGHATLAAACVLFQHYGNVNSVLEFNTLSGVLTATKEDGKITLDLPLADVAEQIPQSARRILQVISPNISDAQPTLRYSCLTKKLLVRLPDTWSRQDLEAIAVPERSSLLSVHDGADIAGVILTLLNGGADDSNQPYDFVSRYFAAWNGIDEDPVTGSAHTVLGKYWACELNKSKLYARQCSSRGGDLQLVVHGDTARVHVAGSAYIVLSGTLHLPV